MTATVPEATTSTVDAPVTDTTVNHGQTDRPTVTVLAPENPDVAAWDTDGGHSGPDAT